MKRSAMQMRNTRMVGALLALIHASACIAILVPEEHDIVPCNTVDDCDDPEDNRYVADCVYGTGQAEDSPKVCVADFDARGCNPTEDFASDHPVALAYADATDNASSLLYVACTPENLGKQGCGLDLNAASPCDAGLVPTGQGICDDEDPSTPKAIAPNLLAAANVEPAGQDVLDHFCRWWMGDADWACDTSGFRCRPCDEQALVGKGGCGQIYLQGAPATTYTDLSDANDGSKSDEAITFGPIPN